jgi:hypothetical protein
MLAHPGSASAARGILRRVPTQAILLTLRCPDCGHRWTVEVCERYGPELERPVLCEECCSEVGVEFALD